MACKVVSLFIALGLPATAVLAQVPAPAAWPIAGPNYDDAAQYAFIPAAIGDAEVVSLAESIHMTYEFPLVRLGIVKRLHETSGFNAVGTRPDDL